MKLYLARHGEYAAVGKGGLTEKGEADIARIATFIKPLQLSVAHIFHSDKYRAKQTAELLAQGFHCEETPVLRVGLNPDDDIATLAAGLVDEQKDELYVGHLPFMMKLTSYLLTGHDHKEIVAFSTGTLVCLEQIDRSHWALAWALKPDLLPEYTE